LSCVSQYYLPANLSPEQFVHNMLIDIANDCDYIRYAKDIKAVSDSHEWLNKIIERSGENEAVALSKIIDTAARHPSWKQYIKPIEEWLSNKKKKGNSG